MKAAFYSGASGIMAQQTLLDDIGNNLANVNTTGFIPTRVSFQTLLNTEMYANTPDDPITEYGTRTIDTGLLMGTGSYIQTSFELDFAVMGDGFFAVEKGGEVEYTKDGSFTIMIDGDSGFLGTVDGAYVLDENGEPIQLEKEVGTQEFILDSLVETIGVYEFSVPEHLTEYRFNRYGANELTGDAVSITEENREVRQFMLQGSGTDMTTEMSEMIIAQRAYQLSARVIQVADENEQVINNLRG